jgi:tRNA(fMet)-specific endonuclease VapC
MVVLDTDLMTLLGWSDGQIGLRLRSRLAQIPSYEITTTVITFEEYTRGWLSLLAQSKKIKEQIQTYRRLNRQLLLFCSTLVLDFDEKAAIEYQRLKKEYSRLGTMDLRIAAIVISQSAVLLSRNLRDLHQVSGLQVEDWTKE